MRMIEISAPGSVRQAFAMEVPGDIRALRVNASGTRAAAATVDGQVLTLEVIDSAPVWRLWAAGRRCRALAWSPDGEQLAAEIDRRLVVGDAAGGRDTGAHVEDASDLVWWKQHTIAIATPIAWPPIALYAPGGEALGTLAPVVRPVGTHSPKLAVARDVEALAFSYVQDVVAVFAATADCREVPPPSASVPSTSALTHHLRLSADASRAAVVAAPMQAESLTDIRTADLATQTFLPAIRIAASAVLAFSPQLSAGYCAPRGKKQVIRWSAAEPPVLLGVTPEPMWGLEVVGRQLWMWSWRRLAILDLADKNDSG
ncbi:MAG: hypothetical protein ABSB49_15755 [Polyangia bacterium]